MERSELTFLLTRTAAAGATKALALCDHQPDAITKSQAYRLYGRSDVDRWLSEKLLIPNTKNRLNKAALARIAAKSNRTTYLPVAER
jgi:hypothetical protein